MRRHVSKGFGAAVLIVLGLGLINGSATAQQRVDMTAERPRYDTATEETIEGVVAAVVLDTEWTQRMRTRNPALRGTRGSRLARVRMAGTHVLLDTTRGDIEVHISPTAFLETNGFEIVRHEPMKIVGSRIIVNDEAMIVAREITQEGRTLTLRNADGTPRWSQR